MKKLFLAAAFSLFAAASAHAGLVLDIYAGATASGGYGYLHLPDNSPLGNNIKSSYHTYGAVVGIDIPYLRAEAEYNYLTGRDANLHAGMINGYFKWLPTPIIKPYIGAGFGMIFGGDLKGQAGDADAETSPAIQGMIGLQIEIPATHLTADVEYRLLYADRIYTYQGTDDQIAYIQSDIRLKLRYAF
jgi:opacity protein-like surface antigen